MTPHIRYDSIGRTAFMCGHWLKLLAAIQSAAKQSVGTYSIYRTIISDSAFSGDVSVTFIFYAFYAFPPPSWMRIFFIPLHFLFISIYLCVCSTHAEPAQQLPRPLCALPCHGKLLYAPDSGVGIFAYCSQKWQPLKKKDRRVHTGCHSLGV